jgi:hypothetical protein
MKNNNEFDSFISTAEKAMEELEKIKNDANLTDEEREEMSQSHLDALKEQQEMFDDLTKRMQKRLRKKEKISKYSLGEALRKHKVFLYSILSIDSNSTIDGVTTDMYEILDNTLNFPDEVARHRLSQLYSISLRKNISSFKESVIEIFDKWKNEDCVNDYVADFYKTYMNILVDAVQDKYNKEIEEREKLQDKIKESEADKKNPNVQTLADKIHDGD